MAPQVNENEGSETTYEHILDEYQYVMKQTIEHPMTTKSKAGIFKQKVCSTQFKDYQMEQHKDEPNNVSEALLSKN